MSISIIDRHELEKRLELLQLAMENAERLYVAQWRKLWEEREEIEAELNDLCDSFPRVAELD